MSDNTPKEWLTPEQAAERCGVSAETVRQWILRGVRFRAARHRVRLQGRRVGTRHQTCPAWIDEFFAACTAAGQPEEAAPTMPVESPDQMRQRFRREKELAAKRLKKAGAA